MAFVDSHIPITVGPRSYFGEVVDWGAPRQLPDLENQK